MKILTINSLPEDWIDRDCIMLHSCFQVLVDYVEQEPLDSVDWEYTQEQHNAYREIRDLYDWWKTRRPLRIEKSYDDMLANDCDDQSKLERLIAIRTFLWT